MGRRTKFTQETRAKLEQAFKLGATVEIACGFAGIDPATYYRWMERGRSQKTGQHREFCDDIARAQGTGAVGWLAKIEKAANDGDWRAAAWKLERRYPEKYGRTVSETRVSGADGGAIRFERVGQARDEVGALSLEQIDEIENMILNNDRATGRQGDRDDELSSVAVSCLNPRDDDGE